MIEGDTDKHDYEIVDFDVFKEPCSIHVPLNQILNMIITSFESLPSMTEVILEKLEGHGNLLQTIDPVITVLTVFAQIKCGMWKRNGIYLVEGQHHYYHDPSINAHNKSNDLMLLQIACSIIPGECTVWNFQNCSITWILREINF